MSLTSLHLEAPKPPARIVRDERCPQCKAPKDRRVNASGFGTLSIVLCEACGHEFKDA